MIFFSFFHIFAKFFPNRHEISESHIVKSSHIASRLRHSTRPVVRLALAHHTAGLPHSRLRTVATPAANLPCHRILTSFGHSLCRHRRIYDGGTEKQKPPVASQFLHAQQHPHPSARHRRPVASTATKQSHDDFRDLCVFHPIRILSDAPSPHRFLHLSPPLPRLPILPAHPPPHPRLLASPNLFPFLHLPHLPCFTHSHSSAILVLRRHIHRYPNPATIPHTSAIHNHPSRNPPPSRLISPTTIFRHPSTFLILPPISPPLPPHAHHRHH